ncbi:MAG: hypothetical protein D6756_00615 [Cyanobacteria bacterium J083]|nr:MAG: hypothetical protein D6756_00615 [Cyanobacteria bacterium J083]
MNFFSQPTNKKWQKYLVPLIAVSGICGTTTNANALTFDFSYAPGTTLEQMIGFETAGQIWSSYLEDDVTVRIHVEMSNTLPENVIGGALPGWQFKQNYTQFRQQVFNDRLSTDDYTAHESLGISDYDVLLEKRTYRNIDSLSLTNANAKSLGLITDNPENLDAYILMSHLTDYSNVSWSYNFDRQQENDHHSLDFLSTAMHEIGHALGFVSGVDSAKVKDQDATLKENLERIVKTTSLDLYRYSKNSKKRQVLDLGVGHQSYFSLDGGETIIGNFARGKQENLQGVDGFQASHWKYDNNNPLGIMTPALKKGETLEITDLDLRAFDVIGWDRSVFNPIDYNQMMQAGKTSLAQRFDSNADASLIDNYLNNIDPIVAVNAANSLSEDKTNQVIQMLQQSEIYEWGSWGGGGNCTGCNNQVLVDDLAQNGIFNQSLYWSTLSTPSVTTASAAASTPEPTALFSLVGLGLFVLKSHQKRK